ncbi:MAG: hypothetical protein IPO53_04625 [Chitinophagaceae bacterium]|nr:hypothetical protein [Chitinophagaceae bacterium]
MKKLLIAVLLLSAVYTQAQVKIGDNPGTIDANSLLELESTNKGFLAPRVTLTSITSVSPLTGTVPAGMLVYNSAGSLDLRLLLLGWGRMGKLDIKWQP